MLAKKKNWQDQAIQCCETYPSFGGMRIIQRVTLGIDTFDKELKDSGVLFAFLYATATLAFGLSLSWSSHYPVVNHKARHFFKHPVVVSRISLFFSIPCCRKLNGA